MTKRSRFGKGNRKKKKNSTVTFLQDESAFKIPSSARLSHSDGTDLLPGDHLGQKTRLLFLRTVANDVRYDDVGMEPEADATVVYVRSRNEEIRRIALSERIKKNRTKQQKTWMMDKDSLRLTTNTHCSSETMQLSR
jgi:hypothetical protein